MHVKQISEHPKTGIQQNVSDFRERFTGRRVQRVCFKTVFTQEVCEVDRAFIIQHKQCVAGYWSAEDLMNAHYFLFDEIGKCTRHFVNNEHFDSESVQKYAGTQQL